MKRVLLTCAMVVSIGAFVPPALAKVPESRAEIQLSFVPLVKQAAPAVVNIYAKRIVETRQSPFQNDPFFRDFFQDFGQARPRVQNSLGSGVILSADGIVVSNYHVVGDATDIRVVLNDRREFAAQVLLADADSDLAILKLEGTQDMPHLALRDSASVEVGELVLAIGNPFGVGQTVSSGIVSGLARSGTATGNARGYFIQTDAPINPGNSGGALIDMAGQLIGINTSILTRSGGSNGIGFAIPASLVQEFVDQARDGNTRFERPWAGMTGQPVDADLAEVLGLDRPGGMIVSDLHPASPFLKAGIMPGDVIIAVDGEVVNTPSEMIYRMTIAGLGGKANVTRLRDGTSEDVAVAMISPPEEPPRDEVVLGERDILTGLRLARLNPAVIAEFGLPSFGDGIAVLDPGPLGARVGLRAGDIIRAVNRAVPESPSDVGALMREAGRRISLTVNRGGQQVILSFRL